MANYNLCKTIKGKISRNKRRNHVGKQTAVEASDGAMSANKQPSKRSTEEVQATNARRSERQDNAGKQTAVEASDGTLSADKQPSKSATEEC